MPKVYVVQQAMKFDKRSSSLRPKYDVSSAKRYGEIEWLLSPSAAPFSNESVIEELHQKLQYYTSDDYLLLIGNPALIGFVVAIAAIYSLGHVRVLQWSGKDKRYIDIEAHLQREE